MAVLGELVKSGNVVQSRKVPVFIRRKCRKVLQYEKI